MPCGRIYRAASGSASELKYQVLLSRDLGYMNESVHKELEDQVNTVMRMLYGLMKSQATGRQTRRKQGTDQPTPTSE